MTTEAQTRSDFLTVAVEAAREAGSFLKERFGTIDRYDLKTSHHDLVTEADRTAERIILERIGKAYPDHGILSEESPPRRTDAPYRWVIDPLDGTTNYAHGIPFFGVSIALEERGEVLVGVVYDPLRDELYAAIRGEGAERNGKPLAVSRIADLKGSLLATGFPLRPRLKERNLQILRAFLPRAQSVRRFGSAALCLAYVACGKLEAYWDLSLHRWDMAAGYLLVQEAGGACTDLQGGEVGPEGRELLASNGYIHEQLLDVMKEIP